MSRLGALPTFLALYAAMYAAFGVASPFWPRYFEARGLTPEELGVLFGLGTAMRLLAGPLANRIADLLDALAVRASVRPRGFEYGWVRGAASAAFVAGTLLAGQVLGILELTAIVWMHAALLAGALFGAALVPEADIRS
jgi:MFS transporter, PPP family, 3-phenylpropionic acid transporter